MCGTPPSFRITEALSNCCSHNPSPLESSRKKQHEVRVDVCGVAVDVDVCAVVVIVVVVVVVVMVSAVVTLCVFRDCCVSSVMCPLLCVHPLTSFEVKTRTIFEFLSEIQK